MSEYNGSLKRKKRKRGALYAPVSFVIIVAAMIFGMSVFFKVSHIEVEGAAYYSGDEVIEASGIQVGDNLFFINRFTSASRIYSKLPYIEQAAISRSLPNRVLIEVSESSGLAYFQHKGEYWVLDKSCKALGVVSGTELEGLVRLQGLDISSVATGAAPVEEGDADRLGFLSNILSAMLERDMLADVSYIDISAAASPVFDYLDRFTVKLGRNEDVEYKLELLVASVAQLSTAETGAFDLSVDKKAHFSPG